MFPIILDLTSLKVALIGGGEGAASRLKMLDEAGARFVRVFADNFGKDFWDLAGTRLTTRMPNDEELKSFSAVMVVDLPDEVAAKLAGRARALGIMVNVEDRKEYCDFYFPSVVRRGDLMITVSTGGKSPALARRVREVIGRIFNESWKDKLEEMALRRNQWRDIGLNMKEVADMSNKYIDQKGWLEFEELVGKEEAKS